jgi:hypothetical protein
VVFHRKEQPMLPRAALTGLLDVTLAAQAAQEILDATTSATDQLGQPSIGAAREFVDVRQDDFFGDGERQGGDGRRYCDFNAGRVHNVWYLERNRRAGIGKNLFDAGHHHPPA